MANADTVQAELTDGEPYTIGEGTEWERKTKSVRNMVGTLVWDLTRGLPGIDTGKVPDPDGKKNRVSPVDAIKRIAFEITLWIPRRGPSALKAKQGNKETALGHAADAASFGAINHALIVEVARKQGVDVDKVLAQFEVK
ncbi:hypothetical protein KXR83_05850 [Williamsia muralis]|uniref:hypothetical protein n=1 Tax=Williamsia marianensis TaxID=85044 RepID=UPI003F166AD4